MLSIVGGLIIPHGRGSFLGLRPHELSEALLRAKMARMNLSGSYLEALEKEARSALEADPPIGMTEDFDIEPAQIGHPISYKQENALAVLDHINAITRLSESLSETKESGCVETITFISAPPSHLLKKKSRKLSEKELARRIALEAMRLVLAAVSGSFWSNLWPATRLGAQMVEGRKRPRNRPKEMLRKGWRFLFLTA